MEPIQPALAGDQGMDPHDASDFNWFNRHQTTSNPDPDVIDQRPTWCPRKSPSMMAASWFSNTPEKGEQASCLLLSQPLPREILAKRFGKLRSQQMEIAVKNPDSTKTRRAAASSPFQRFSFQYFSFTHSPLFPRNPLFPALRSCPKCLFQEPPAKANS